uniref:P450 (cytochrome) oxidoreductase n=1 Tax=Ursus maritimus TaxID=29073 RepID=A0A452U9S4_URSMA
MGDSSMDASATVSETVAEEVSLFSMTDMILFSLIVGVLSYWLLFRKKKDEIPEFTKIQPVTSSVKDSSFVEKMKKTGRNIIVFYGSQTGTAEEFANRLSKDAHRYGMRGMAADPEEYDLGDLGSLPEIENSLAVFCMATYGEGDPTDNAQDFYDWLQETDVDLSGVKYAVFGLGNKTYEHFNAMGKYVDKQLEQLGAQRIFELGMGDDDGNLEEDFITWREQFWPAVCEHFGVEATGEESSIRQYELVVHTDLDPAKVYAGEMGRLKSYENQKPPFDAKNPFLAAVTTNRKLNQGTERHLMHLELDISDSKLRYESGDHVAVYPANDSTLVSQLGEILGADLDVVMSLNNLDEESNKKHPFPCPTSYRTALTYYLDITNPPRTNVLYELAQYASEPSEQEQLRKMASSSGEVRLSSVTFRAHRAHNTPGRAKETLPEEGSPLLPQHRGQKPLSGQGGLREPGGQGDTAGGPRLILSCSHACLREPGGQGDTAGGPRLILSCSHACLREPGGQGDTAGGPRLILSCSHAFDCGISGAQPAG